MAKPKRKSTSRAKRNGFSFRSLFKWMMIISFIQRLWRLIRWLVAPRRLTILLILLAVVSFAGMGLYLALPYEAQLEVNRVTKAYFNDDKEVGFSDWFCDVASYYSTERYTPVTTPIDDDALNALPLSPLYPYPLNILRNASYTSGYCEAYGNPAWVTYTITDLEQAYPIPSRPPFRADSRSKALVKPDDYTNSGYDRGHMAPNFGIARTYGSQGQAETFLMTNIVPQEHGLNAGPWRDLERRVALNYAPRFGSVIVVTGPVYYNTTPKRINTNIAIPDAFYKIVLAKNHCGLLAYAFLFPHDDLASRDLSRYLTSIDRIEELTGLDFFPRLPREIQNPLESKIQSSP